VSASKLPFLWLDVFTFLCNKPNFMGFCSHEKIFLVVPCCSSFTVHWTQHTRTRLHCRVFLIHQEFCIQLPTVPKPHILPCSLHWYLDGVNTQSYWFRFYKRCKVQEITCYRNPIRWRSSCLTGNSRSRSEWIDIKPHTSALIDSKRSFTHCWW